MASSAAGTEPDIVYGAHDFVAENPDELSFKQGERILVIERDDLYQDGWWQGENTNGERGLFPQTYTQKTNPLAASTDATPKVAAAAVMSSSEAEDAGTAIHNHGIVSPQPEVPSSHKTMNDIAKHLEEMENRQPNGIPNGESSITSAKSTEATGNGHPDAFRHDSLSSLHDDSASEISREAEETTPHSAAVDLHENLARNIELAREREEARKLAEEREREAERERLRLAGPPVEGLLLSDESEDEDSALVDDHDDNDDDSIFPSRRVGDRSEHVDHEVKNQDHTSQSSLVDESRTPPASTSERFASQALGSTVLASDPTVTRHDTLMRTPEPLRTATSASAASPSSSYLPTPQNQTPAVEKQKEVLASRDDDVSASPSKTSVPPAVTTDTAEEEQEQLRPAILAGTGAVVAGTAAIASARVIGARQTMDTAPGQEPLMALVEPNKESTPRSPIKSTFAPPTTTSNQSPRSVQFPRYSAPVDDPREWSVGRVVEWAQGKNFDDSITSKLQEHEISGDVLVDMDVSTLKEIDIIAFGPRAKLAKAIRELRATFEPVSAGFSDSASMQGSVLGSSIIRSPPVDGLPLTPESPSARRVFSSSSQPGSPLAASYHESTRGLGLKNGSDTTHAEGPSASVTSNTAPSSTGDGASRRHSRMNSTADTADASRETPATSAQASPVRKDRSSIGGVSLPFSMPGSKARTSTAPSANSESEKAEKGSGGSRGFLNTSLGRGRKPPPRYSGPTEQAAVQSKNSLRSSKTSSAGNRFSGRLFGQSGHSPSASVGGKEMDKSVISGPVEGSYSGPSSPLSRDVSAVSAVSPQTVQAAPAATKVLETGANDSNKVLTPAQRIGDADYAGWLRKRGDRYNSWKDRYLILKGGHLYVLKSPNEEKIKGWVDLNGYKFISDGSGERNKFSFKAIHETKPTHYFSANEMTVTRNWMKALMKATIDRDYTQPVTSSSNIKTIPLSVAQAMNPPPRPPSPTSARNMQKASLQQNPNTLSAQDAAKLMGSPLVVPSAGTRRVSTGGVSNASSMAPTATSSPKRKGMLPPLRSSARKKPVADDTTESKRKSVPFDNVTERPTTQTEKTPTKASVAQPAPSEELLAWVNDHVPSDTPKAVDWQDLSSGRVLTRLVENLSGRPSNIPDTEFAKFKPIKRGQAPDMNYLDTLFATYDYLIDRGIKTDDVSLNDLLTGNISQIAKLARLIREHYSSQ